MFETKSVGDDDNHPTDSITPEEKAAGFELSTVPNLLPSFGSAQRFRAVVCNLGNGKIAVKTKVPFSGDIEYSVRNEADGNPTAGPYSDLARVLALKSR